MLLLITVFMVQNVQLSSGQVVSQAEAIRTGQSGSIVDAPRTPSGGGGGVSAPVPIMAGEPVFVELTDERVKDVSVAPTILRRVDGQFVSTGRELTPEGVRELESQRIRPRTQLELGITSRRKRVSSATVVPSVFGAATPAESEVLAKARKREAPTFFPSVLRGFRDPLGAGGAAPRTVSEQVGESLGAFALFTPIGGVGKVKGAVRGAGKALKAAKATRGGQFVFNIGAGVVQGTAASQAAIFGGRLTRPESEREAVMGVPDFQNIIGASFAAEQEAVSQQGFLKGLAFEVSPFFSSKKEVFSETLKSELESQGLVGFQLQEAVAAGQRERVSRSIGEALGLVSISRFSESVGRRGVTQAFGKAAEKGVVVTEKKVGGQVFKLAAPRIAEAGAIEGFSQSIVQDLSRAQKVDPKRAGLFAGFGAISAGLLGGTIASTRIARPAVSRTLNIAANIADPFELQGDLLQDAFEATQKRFLGKVAPKPTIFVQTDASKAVRFGTLTPSAGKRKAPAPVISQAPVSLEALVSAPVSAPVKTRVSVPTFGFGGPIFAPSPVKVPSFIPSPVPSPVPIFTPTPAEVPVTTATPTFITSFTIPTPTPILRVPPILPLGVPSSGRGGFGLGKPKAFFNELAAGKNLLGNLLGASSGIGASLAGATPKKKSKVSKKSKKSKASKIGPSNDLLGDIFGKGGVF